MDIKIDANVNFEFNGEGRKATLDAYELAKFVETLYQVKGVEGLTADGKPTRELTWDLIITEITAYVKIKTGLDITPAEAIGVFKNSGPAWEAKKKSWVPPREPLPISSPSTDPRYAA